jgi:NAD(P)-dependent dehydrogenase (short-subunit alcohol dehydrogenase family)
VWCGIWEDMSIHSGKIALITGANKGIGLETARLLGRQAVTVIVGARDSEKAAKAALTLKDEGLDAVPLKLDVSSTADIQAAAKFIESKYGRLDILINNAGIFIGRGFSGNDSETVTPADLHKTFDTNFFAVVELTQALLPLIRKSPAGRIVNLSSILGSLTLHSDPKSPIAGSKSLAYNASKTALNAFTIHLAAALKDTKIKVNSAHPGWVKTDMGGEGAPMEIHDGAKTSVELALLGDDGPTGAYIHLGKPLPW